MLLEPFAQEDPERCTAAVTVSGYDFAWCPYSLRGATSDDALVNCPHVGTKLEDSAITSDGQLIGRCHSLNVPEFLPTLESHLTRLRAEIALRKGTPLSLVGMD